MFSSLKVRIYNDPCLRKKSEEVKEVGVSERMLIAAMIETMHKNHGIGLAAPQVGINQRIIVVDVGDGGGPLILVNPVIKRRSGKAVMEEGCLSLPGIAIDVTRADNVWVQYTDEDNQQKTKPFRELLARVIQHETDHLNGKLITDYAGWGQKRKIKKQLSELEKFGKVLTEPVVFKREKEKTPHDSADRTA